MPDTSDSAILDTRFPGFALDNTAPMQLTFGSKINGIGLFGGNELTEIYLFTISLDSGSELLFETLRIHANTEKSSCGVAMWAPKILFVHGIRCFAQIDKTIIVTNSIHVIYLVTRPPACRKQPREPMRSVQVLINFDAPIPKHKTSSDLSYFDLGSAPRTCAPNENTCLGIVSKDFPESIESYGTYNRLSHDASTFADWLESACVSSAGRLANFTPFQP